MKIFASTTILAFATCFSASTTTTASAQPTGSIRGAFADRSLQTLEQRWNLTEPEFLYDGLEFTLDYTMSDYIQDQFVDFALYDGEECKEGATDITENIYLGSQVSPDQTPIGSGTGEREMTLTLTINPNTISNSAVYANDDQDNARVFFCVRFSLFNGDADGADAIETNFIETLITLNVDLTDNFSIEDVNVTPKEREEESANQVYEVEAYECGANNVEIFSDAPRNQGSAIRICVTPTQDAVDAGVFMRQINFFDFTRGDITQAAVEADNQEASNGLTILACEAGSLVCAFETLLQADFFFETGTVSGAGEALMQFGDGVSARRELVKIVSRATQEEDGLAGDSEISINFEVIGDDDEAAITSSSGSSIGGVVGGVVVAAVASVLIIAAFVVKRRTQKQVQEAEA